MFHSCSATGNQYDILSETDPGSRRMNIHTRLEFQRLRQKAELSLEEAAVILGLSDRQVRRYEDITELGSDPSALVIEKMKAAASWNERVEQARSGYRSPESPRFTFIDLFAGIG